MKVYATIWTISAVMALHLILSGCSFQVGFGYHGTTGLDAREASELAVKKGGK